MPLHTGERTGCHYLGCLCLSICLSVCLSVRPSLCMSVCLSASLSVYRVCITFVFFTDCESCTRPISTNPGSMEAGEYGLTRGTRFFARPLEVVAVAGLLWTSWCVLGAAGFRVFLTFFFRTHTACCKYEAVLPHLPLY